MEIRPQLVVEATCCWGKATTKSYIKTCGRGGIAQLFVEGQPQLVHVSRPIEEKEL